MRIALISDQFPPLRSSGAVQMRDLSLEFVKQGHQPTVMFPSPGLNSPWIVEDWKGVQIIRLKVLKTRDIRYVHRTIGELLMPFTMLHNLRGSPVAQQRWDGVVWYSPNIFWGPLIRSLKQSSNCRSYLILRDIFPEWVVDLGLMGRGLPYLFFKAIERFQYSVADVIGVQTQANIAYFKKWSSQPIRRVEVLKNWLSDTPNAGCSISISNSILVGRKIFVYAGNMGIAQGVGILLDLAENLMVRKDIGFLFVGRGSSAQQLISESKSRGLDNTLVYSEIDPSEIPGLYEQCHVGLVVLDPRHKTHNLPGKFLSYMLSGLPVLASINPNNDLEELITSERIGRVCTENSVNKLKCLAEDLLKDLSVDVGMRSRCLELSKKMFSPEIAVNQIVRALSQ